MVEVHFYALSLHVFCTQPVSTSVSMTSICTLLCKVVKLKLNTADTCIQFDNATQKTFVLGV